ncbi:MAG: beta-propeller domain-containing protein [Candidatus Paceibacterota bacterium]|jgi:uncharacterized secreted protein with C-terminal beta-propeller domain
MDKTSIANFFHLIRTKLVDTRLGILILLAFSAAAFGIVFLTTGFSPSSIDQDKFSSKKGDVQPDSSDSVKIPVQGIKQFEDEEDFKAYLLDSELNSSYSGLGGNQIAVDMASSEKTAPTTAVRSPDGGYSGSAQLSSGGSSVAGRFSGTNIQVAGIDEPDIIKTNGKEIYYSSDTPISWLMENVRSSGMPSFENPGETKVISAFPTSSLSLETNIKKSGDLLLTDNILVVFSGNALVGYDISNPAKPQKTWELKLGNQNYVTDARLYEGKIYLITRTQINDLQPCPIKPLVWGEDGSLTVACNQIYHPAATTPVDSIYNALLIDPKDGSVKNNLSITGTNGRSAVYMSSSAIYVTYSYSADMIDFFYKFISQKAVSVFPSGTIEKIERLKDYGISSQAKYVELSFILQQYVNTLDEDEQLKLNNNIQNLLGDYYKEQKREIERTGIAKISLADFSLAASGSIPGTLLNQFSLDEYKGYLRVASTAGQGGFWGFGPFWTSGGTSVNDVYTLDDNLKIAGSILDISKGWNDERIYAVRFVQDRGYIVTYKETDPLLVADLSDPVNPTLAGQLEILGYSSYLHPLSGSKILGIGKEDLKVKLSLFDVGDAENPKEISKFTLDEYWSEATENHHAFMEDKDRQIVFLPGSKGGYVFSYKNDKLTLEKAVSGVQIKRAVYIDNYLYVLGQDNLTVLDENTWKKVGSLDF